VADVREGAQAGRRVIVTEYRTKDALAQLYDFQRTTVTHAFRRLYEAPDSTRRFLVADETGLGKTHIAAGIIAKTIEYLQHVDEVRRIDVVYVCSNADIAEQNLRKLMVGSANTGAATAPRLTLLVTYPDVLRPAAQAAAKPVTFVGFTPGTSFEFGWRTGQAEERAALFLLLADHLDLARADETALKRILQGTVATLEGFGRYIDRLTDRTGGRWERGIQQTFLRAFDRSSTGRELIGLVAQVRGRGRLSNEQREAARHLTGELRQLLAESSVRALEPDLVILDESQRFRHLLATDTPAGELAGQLFGQPHAHVLLLSATPYKPFTYAEESAQGDDHYEDFVRTLEFLANGTDATKNIRAGLVGLRRAALAGEPVVQWKHGLEQSLCRLMSRTERPPVGTDGMLAEQDPEANDIEAEDLAGFVSLRRLADMLEAPLTVEYWKSAPYFGNFLDGYKVGEKLKDAIKDPARHAELQPAIRRLQRLRRRDIARFQRVDWGNARLRRLAAETVDKGWWRLLWVPASLPYHAPAGPYAAAEAQGMTKRLIFSSWVAAPSAIASLLSYEAERRIHTGAGRFENTPDARAAITSRVQYRLDSGRPASMTTLALFWPSPALAEATDPLVAAREAERELRPAEAVLEWAAARIRPRVGAEGTARTPGSTAWFWAAPLLMEAGKRSAKALKRIDDALLLDALAGSAKEEPETAIPRSVLGAHVALAQQTLGGQAPGVERPADLVETVALLGVGAPGNIAWRSLRRTLPISHHVSDTGLWRAAAILATGLRSLFSRPEVTLLLSGQDADESAYWQTVARYCHEGNLQAVLDEYLHHLVESGGFDASTDQGLLDVAAAARRALTIRAARYVALDPDHGLRREGIPFLSRFALRFGSIQQEQDDVRLPEVRTAFNSPFWPFVLASTSIGQEGVDFHWWCHAVVHWNLPANPVDFEQREGRINRYKCHAVRRNVAAQFRREALASDDADPWRGLFASARAARAEGANDLHPYWVFPGPSHIERHLLTYPLSRDVIRWEQLQELLALYRLAFGQPRQDDMVALLARRGLRDDAERVAELGLDLRPET
jgi:hypothetical protein